MNDANDAFISHLKAYRKRRGWSQQRLAAAVGIHQTQISKIEHGQRNVRLSEAVRICDALGLDLVHMIGRERTVITIGGGNFQ